MKIFRNNEEINIDNKNIKDYLTGKYIKWSDKCPVYYSFIHSVDVNNDFILLDMDEIYYSREFSFYDFNKNIKRKIPIEGIESYFENHGYNVEISDKETFIELLKKTISEIQHEYIRK